MLVVLEWLGNIKAMPFEDIPQWALYIVAQLEAARSRIAVLVHERREDVPDEAVLIYINPEWILGLISKGETNGN